MTMTTRAPIALFCYRRPVHLARTLEALAGNPGASESELVIFADGPRSEQDRADVEATREVAARARGFASVEVRAAAENQGLAPSIIAGISAMVKAHGRVIVVEDDLVTAPYFLKYMNEGLALYADADRVASIHGYVYPCATPLPETFFLRGADCWGWATWARAWALFESDGAKLLAELRQRRLTRDFDLGGAFPYTRMLKDQIAGRNSSWAIRWHASAFLADRLTLYPGRSLVQNIGNDASGTHASASDLYRVELSDRPIAVRALPLQQSEQAVQAFANFFRRQRGGPVRRAARRLRALWR